MIIPTKHQALEKNVLVIGADILHALRKDSMTIENLFQVIKKDHNVKIDLVLDSIVFLWLLEAINMEGNLISSRKKKAE